MKQKDSSDFIPKVENYIDKVFNMNCLDGLRTLPDESVDCCVTSPPYYALRDYDCDGQIGLEETPEKYIEKLTEVFREVYRVLKPQGTLWLNIGDSYWGGGWRNAQFNEHSGELQKAHKGTHCGEQMPACKGNSGAYKPKDLIGIPWMLAFSLRNAGWYLRQDIIWNKPNPMPESVTDRCTKSHEYIFLMSKSRRYYYDYESISEPCVDQYRTNFQSGCRANGINKDRNDNDLGTRSKDWMPRKKAFQDEMLTTKIRFGGKKYGDNNDKHFQTYSGKEWKPQFNPEGIMVRNKRDVWTVNVKSDNVAHFATYPEELIQPCILAGCPSDGIVLDPFMGSGTTAKVARMLNRHFVGFELNKDYCKIIQNKIQVSRDLFY